MKKQLLAFLATEPLAIERSWLQALIDTISLEGITENLSPDMMKALMIDPGQKIEGTERASIRGNVGIISLSGPIFPAHNILTRWLGIGTVLPDFLSDVKAMVDDFKIDSIIIDVDSPGGSVNGINEAAALLNAWSAEKPIISYTGGSNASAAYWLTSAAGKLYADATARVGSIGVLATFYKDEEDGMIEIANSRSPKKALNPSSEEGRKEVLKTIDALADVFIGSVAKHRGISEDKVVSDFGQGGVLVGQAAVDVGMVDGLDSFEELVSKHSTDGTKNFFVGSLKGESQMELTLEVLKAKFPQVYEAACAEATAPLTAQIADKNRQIKALEENVVALEAQNENAKTENATLSGRVEALEKANQLAAQKEAEAVLKAKATGIADKTLAASGLPERMHSKVKSIVDYNKFVDAQGVLDEAGYTAALGNEIKDYEAILNPNDVVSGINSGSAHESAVAADDDLVSRMLNHVGVSA